MLERFTWIEQHDNMTSAPTWRRHRTCTVVIINYVYCISPIWLWSICASTLHSSFLLWNHLISHIRCSLCSTLFTFKVIHADDAARPRCVFWPYIRLTRSRGEDRWGLYRDSKQVQQKKRFKSVSKHKKNKVSYKPPLEEDALHLLYNRYHYSP